MEIIIQDSATNGSQLAAQKIAKMIKQNPSMVFGLPTGSTPLKLYQELIRIHKSTGLDFSNIKTFNLDEYLGLAPEHPASYASFMWKEFFSHINIKKENVHIPNGLVADIPSFCQDYEREIKAAGGIDLQILGLGSDGHIAFNEPGSSLVSRTRIKTLTQNTIKDNAQFFDGDINKVPYHVITMGVGTIMEAKEIMLLAFGLNKARAVRDMAEGAISAMVPASILQMHEKVQVFLDEDSASTLKRQDYYRWAYAQKPDWQKG